MSTERACKHRRQSRLNVPLNLKSVGKRSCLKEKFFLFFLKWLFDIKKISQRSSLKSRLSLNAEVFLRVCTCFESRLIPAQHSLMLQMFTTALWCGVYACGAKQPCCFSLFASIIDTVITLILFSRLTFIILMRLIRLSQSAGQHSTACRSDKIGLAPSLSPSLSLYLRRDIVVKSVHSADSL